MPLLRTIAIAGLFLWLFIVRREAYRAYCRTTKRLIPGLF